MNTVWFWIVSAKLSDTISLIQIRKLKWEYWYIRSNDQNTTRIQEAIFTYQILSISNDRDLIHTTSWWDYDSPRRSSDNSNIYHDTSEFLPKTDSCNNQNKIFRDPDNPLAVRTRLKLYLDDTWNRYKQNTNIWKKIRKQCCIKWISWEEQRSKPKFIFSIQVDASSFFPEIFHQVFHGFKMNSNDIFNTTISHIVYKSFGIPEPIQSDTLKIRNLQAAHDRQRNLSHVQTYFRICDGSMSLSGIHRW